MMRLGKTCLGLCAVMAVAVLAIGGCPFSGTTGTTGTTGDSTGGSQTGGSTDDSQTGGTQGDVSSGESLYNQKCAICHSLGSVDTTGAPDLSGEGDEVVSDLTTISAAMAGVGTLTDQQVADLAAYLDAN